MASRMREHVIQLAYYRLVLSVVRPESSELFHRLLVSKRLKSNRRDEGSHKGPFLLVLLSKLLRSTCRLNCPEQRILFKAHHVWVGFCPEHSGYGARGYDCELVSPNFRDFHILRQIKQSNIATSLTNHNFHA